MDGLWMAWKEEIIMELHILQVGDVLVSPDIFTEKFCCDLDACKGACCIEGDAGAPVTMDETLAIEDVLDTVWPSLSAQAQSVIDRGGVAYTDEEGDLVTSIVGGKDCVFSCALYPIREKQFAPNLYGLNYHRWKICAPGRKKGEELGLPLYRFLEGPLTRRFGKAWYEELCSIAKEQGL